VIGNAVAAIVGLATAHLVPSPILVSAIALAFTVGALGALRSIHPPSGDLALRAVSLGAQPWLASMNFLIEKVMLRDFTML
jgi:CBS domain-containing membrane protein